MNRCTYVLLAFLIAPLTIRAASLEPVTLKAWDQYIESALKGMDQRLGPGGHFLWIDEDPDRLAKVRKGGVVISPLGSENPKKVPSGLIHDWMGAIFIPGATLSHVRQIVNDYARYKEWYPPSVVDSKVLPSWGGKDRFSMRVVNKSFLLKTALDADYESCYFNVDHQRGYSVTKMTRMQEIEQYDTPAQRILPEGEGTGLVWRLFGITRYLERDGGVYLEREAIGLSRDIPASVRWLAEPIVRRVSRSSLATSLRQTEDAVKR